MAAPEDARRGPPAVYWIVVIGLILFGYVGAFSIGPPLIVLGLFLLLLSVVYPYPLAFWPLGIFFFVICAAWFIQLLPLD